MAETLVNIPAGIAAPASGSTLSESRIESKITGGWALVVGGVTLYVIGGSRFGRLAVGLTSVALLYQLVSLFAPAKQVTESPSKVAAQK